MSEQEFPRELIERCCDAAFGRGFDWVNTIKAILRESGHAELVATLKDARPYVRSFARFNNDKRADSLLDDIDAALRKAGEP